MHVFGRGRRVLLSYATATGCFGAPGTGYGVDRVPMAVDTHTGYMGSDQALVAGKYLDYLDLDSSSRFLAPVW